MLPSSPLLSQYQDISPGEFCSQACVLNTSPELCTCLNLIRLPRNKLVELVIADTGKWCSIPLLEYLVPWPSERTLMRQFINKDTLRDHSTGKQYQLNKIRISNNRAGLMSEVSSASTLFHGDGKIVFVRTTQSSCSGFFHFQWFYLGLEIPTSHDTLKVLDGHPSKYCTRSTLLNTGDNDWCIRSTCSPAQTSL